MSVEHSATKADGASELTSVVVMDERVPSLVAPVQAPGSSATVASTAAAATTSSCRATVREGGGTGRRRVGKGKEGGGQASPRLPSICHHLKRRSQCVQCYDEGTGGSTICKHRKQKYACRSCFDEGDTATKSLCEHRLIRIKCKICTPVRKEVKAYRPRVNLDDLATNLKKKGSNFSAGSSRAPSRLREPVMPGGTVASGSKFLTRPSNMITLSSSSAFTASVSISCVSGASMASSSDGGIDFAASVNKTRTSPNSDIPTCVKCGTDKRLTLYGFAKTPICRPCHKILQDALISTATKPASEPGASRMSRSATPLPQPSFADTFLPPVHSPSSNSTNTPAFFGMLPSISQTPVTPHPATNLHSPIKRSLRFSTSDASTAKRTKIFTALPPASETVPTPNLTPDVSPSRGRDDGDGSGDRIPHEKCVRCGQHGLAGARRLPNDVLQCVRCDCEMNAPYTDLTEDEVASEEGTVASGAEEEKELEAVQGLREGVRRSGRVKKAIAKVVELPPTGGRRRLQRGKPVATAFTVRDGDETEAGSMVETVSNCGSSSAEGSFVGMVGVLAAAAAALVAVGDDTNAAVENMVMDESAKMEGGIHVADVEDGDDEAAFILAGLGVLRS